MSKSVPVTGRGRCTGLYRLPEEEGALVCAGLWQRKVRRPVLVTGRGRGAGLCWSLAAEGAQACTGYRDEEGTLFCIVKVLQMRENHLYTVLLNVGSAYYMVTHKQLKQEFSFNNATQPYSLTSSGQLLKKTILQI